MLIRLPYRNAGFEVLCFQKQETMHFSFYFFVLFRAILSRSQKKAPVNTLRVVQLEFPASLESRDPRDPRDYLEIMDLKDPKVDVDTKVK